MVDRNFLTRAWIDGVEVAGDDDEDSVTSLHS